VINTVRTEKFPTLKQHNSYNCINNNNNNISLFQTRGPYRRDRRHKSTKNG